MRIIRAAESSPDAVPLRGLPAVWSGILRAARSRRARLVGVAAAGLYLTAFALLSRVLIIDLGAGFGRFAAVPGVMVPPRISLDDVLSPFRSIAVIYLSDHVALQVTVVLIGGALIMAALIGMNVAVAVAQMQYRLRSCRTHAPFAVLTALPGFISAFTCCVPTLLLVLGANFAVALTSIAPIALPASAALAGALLAWSAARLQREAAEA